MDRKRIAELASRRIGKHRTEEKRPAARTGGQALSLILTEEEIPELEEEPKPQVVLYLRDGLKGSTANWTKYPNEMHDLVAERLDVAESVLYVRLWRDSWGYNRNYCRYSHSKTLEETSIKSIGTARRAMMGLIVKQFIIRALRQEDRKHDVNKEGALYRILTPQEILESVTEEGVHLSDIPPEGVICVIMISEIIEKKPSKIGDSDTMINMSMINMDNDQYEHDLHDQGSMINMSMINMIRVGENEETTGDEPTMINTIMINKDTPLKDNKDSLKDTLSPEKIISGFYNGIGQSKISKEKRERADRNIKELMKDGFSPRDIRFAVEWTLQNSKEEPYDFSIIKHTIGQAIAAEKKMEEEKAKKHKEEKREAQQVAEEKRRAEEEVQIKAYKESLDAEERAELRERAESEIRSSGQFKEEFITDFLIEIKENSLIRERLGIKPLE